MPTNFAIELLERIKHLFGIPNIVFVLGIDRAQLGSSVKSVYGEIDVDGYLRRFFDMEFSLPFAKPSLYCSHLLQRHQLPQHFQNLRNVTQNDIHRIDYDDSKSILPELCDWFQLSLRNVEHVVRQFVFASRNLKEKNRFYPVLVACLLVIRATNRKLYEEFVTGQCRTSKVLNYIEEQLSLQSLSQEDKNLHEHILVMFYLMAFNRYAEQKHESNQLNLIAKGETPDKPEYLSNYTVEMEPERLMKFVEWYFALRERISIPNIPATTL